MKKIALVLLCLSMNTAVFSATNLIEVYQQALVSDQIFQQAISQRLADKENIPIGVAALLPTANIGLTPSYSKASASGSAALGGSNSSRGYDMALTVTQTLFDFGKIAVANGARAFSNQADATLNASMQDLMVRTAKSYFNILNDEDNLVYNLATKKAFAKQLDQITQQYKVGLKTITDVYTAKASYDIAVANYIAAENQLVNDQENLRVITGIFYPKLATLNNRFPLISPHPADIESWVQTALHQNWEIKAAEYATQSSRQLIKKQFAGHLPTLNAQGVYDINYQRTAADNALLVASGSNHVATTTYSLTLGVPLFAGGGVIAATHQAQYQYQVACQQLEKKTRDTINLTRQSYLGVIAGISKIEADKQAVKSSESSLAGMQAGYEVGTETLVNVLNQQQKVFQAQTQYASDRYAYVNNLLTLKQAAGTLSQQDLVAVNAWLSDQ